jgi:hypothetical protein
VFCLVIVMGGPAGMALSAWQEFVILEKTVIFKTAELTRMIVPSGRVVFTESIIVDPILHVKCNTVVLST